jgi:signal transduction histidine kinase
MALNADLDDPVHQQIKRMKQDCDRLNDLMKSVLNFSGTREYKMISIDLAALLKRLLERWRPRMERLKINQRLQIDTENPSVIGDYRALEQVFTNLISNAINAMRNNGGTLAVNVQDVKHPQSTPMIEINIMDTGLGIPEENMDKIFQPFFTTSKGGTGLGLTITKQIVSAHRGQIDVDSFPGGTVFHVRLPVDITIE